MLTRPDSQHQELHEQALVPGNDNAGKAVSSCQCDLQSFGRFRRPIYGTVYQDQRYPIVSIVSCLLSYFARLFAYVSTQSIDAF